LNISFVQTDPADQSFFEEQLQEHGLEFVRSLEAVDPEADAVSVFIHAKVDRAFLEAHPAVRVILSRSMTLDHIDLAECERRGIAVRNVPTYGDHIVAEHTFALLLAVTRRLREVLANKQSRFSYEKFRVIELRSKTIGLIGIGRIGQQVVPIARAFGMEVIVHDPRLSRPLAEALGVRRVTFDELLAGADFISLHATLTADDYHLLNRETLAKCRRGVIIINTARGALIDTAALAEALESGQVGGVGLDVLEDERVLRRPAEQIVSQEIVDRLRADLGPQEPRDPHRIEQLTELMQSHALLQRPNVVFTPHIGFNSAEAMGRINRATVENIRAFARLE
jgi:D-lactate dehydrogenase